VNAGTAVDMRRKLIGHEHDPHLRRLPEWTMLSTPWRKFVNRPAL
jgi:hypothetical protein